jgi:hypothetical protein
VPVARRALDRVLRDEVHHRDFGWSLLEWMLATPGGAELRALVERELPAQLAEVRAVYAAPDDAGDDGDAGACSRADRAWGLMPRRSYAEIFDATLTRDYIPRFARLGIDAQRLHLRRHAASAAVRVP